jgi:hypothetical protein
LKASSRSASSAHSAQGLAWLARSASVAAQQGIAIALLAGALAHQTFDLRAPILGRQFSQGLSNGRVVIPHCLIRQNLRQVGCAAQQGCQIGQGGYAKYVISSGPKLEAAQQLRQQRGRGRLKAHIKTVDRCRHHRLASMAGRGQCHRIVSR